ncbi:MAG: gas vesicle protein GvpN [Chloroflexi bacterium]|nr:gas vesicle protein GvpN [Chloroflexota bacterium]
MVSEGMPTLLQPRRLPNFVETPFVRSLVDRALTYIAAGFPVHFRGTSGTGKTTLALHVASRIGRPVVMIHGDEEFSTSDLVGGEHGYRMTKVIDNFIHSVLKTEEDMSRRWMDNRLTVACRYGLTLVYDEFTRSRPEANNVLLSVLQEKMLDLPAAREGEGYLRVHPEFTAIFTSNPEEYAGVYRSQDALRDRMITLDLDQFDEETEVAITQAKSGIGRADAERIVRIVRGLRESGACEFAPTVRGCIMVARSLRVANGSIATANGLFRQLCLDILASESSRGGGSSHSARVRQVLSELIDLHQDSDGNRLDALPVLGHQAEN